MVCPFFNDVFCKEYCCYEWSVAESLAARHFCDHFVLKNDECFSEANGFGALDIDPDHDAIAYVASATESLTDPAICCTDSGRCVPENATCHTQAYGTVLFSFVASSANMHLLACPADPEPASTPIVQLLASRDSSSEQAACESAEVVACGDEAGNQCGARAGASLCASGLLPGKKYYVMVGTKQPDRETDYILYLGPASSCRGPAATDYDEDGDTDLRDFGLLQNCFTADGDLAGCCGLLDLSVYDAKLDLRDAADFVSALIGP